MSIFYTLILLLLLALTVYDLTVGVSNDAANFLNSAVGCRAARRSVLVAVAAVGVVLGASFSAGMMEVARSGVFLPHMYGFHDIMILFLAVMLTDVILLDLFNTFGMPTSTTVSLVFELLGAGIAVALFKIYSGGPDVCPNLGEYINSGNALRIISGIFSSVIVAFTCGCVVMWFSRLLFSFRYQRMYRFVGPLWSALALTAIAYFAVFKGLKSSSLVDKATLHMLQDNLGALVSCVFVGWLLLSCLLQYVLRVSTLKFAVLAGTFALALAFAGNDLVNFIGAFMAAHSAYEVANGVAAQGGDLSTLTMGALEGPVQANALYLFAAGAIMVLALAFSKKARTVTDTEVQLARSKASAKERFGSCAAARAAVRCTMNACRLAERVLPACVVNFVSKRFEPLSAEERDDAAFDLVRGSVNLTVAALLISLATSLKLPLSTTYVTFMVGMGSSLADRAWGRESAVYRITGVFTVIGGWFMTGFVACLAAFLAASAMMWLGYWGVGLMIVAAVGILIKSAILHRNRSVQQEKVLNLEDPETMQYVGEHAAADLEQMMDIYRNTVDALLKEDRGALKALKKQARRLGRAQALTRETVVLPTLGQLPPSQARHGQLLLRICEDGISMRESLMSIVKSSFNHIDNNHAGLTQTQAEELMALEAKLELFFPDLCRTLKARDFSREQEIMKQADDLGEEFGACIYRHLLREAEDESGIRTSLLYLSLLNETRSLVRKGFSLIKTERGLFTA